jgi:hypothetical protein
MREIRLSGSVEGVVSNHDPYSDFSLFWRPKYVPMAAEVESFPKEPDVGDEALCRREGRRGKMRWWQWDEDIDAQS